MLPDFTTREIEVANLVLIYSCTNWYLPKTVSLKFVLFQQARVLLLHSSLCCYRVLQLKGSSDFALWFTWLCLPQELLNKREEAQVRKLP